MRTRVKQETLYTFSELSEEARQRAIDWWRDGALDYDWYDYIYYDVKTIGRLMGIEIDNIWFSGFSSQGDGACFTGEYAYAVDSVAKVKQYAPQATELHAIAETLRDVQRPHFYQLRATVTHTGHYYHEHSTAIDVEHAEYPYQDIGEDIAEALRDFMRWIYRQLEMEYRYQMSREVIAENIEANEMEFYESGEVA